MNFALSLKQVGTYLIKEIERARAVGARMAGGEGVTMRVAEVSIAFATANGKDASPMIVVGEAPLVSAEILRQLESLHDLVFVDLENIKRAPKKSVGRLILRILF